MAADELARRQDLLVGRVEGARQLAVAAVAQVLEVRLDQPPRQGEALALGLPARQLDQQAFAQVARAQADGAHRLQRGQNPLDVGLVDLQRGGDHVDRHAQEAALVQLADQELGDGHVGGVQEHGQLVEQVLVQAALVGQQAEDVEGLVRVLGLDQLARLALGQALAALAAVAAAVAAQRVAAGRAERRLVQVEGRVLVQLLHDQVAQLDARELQDLGVLDEAGRDAHLLALLARHAHEHHSTPYSSIFWYSRRR